MRPRLGCLRCLLAAGAGAQASRPSYRLRETVHLGHSGTVTLPWEGNRTVEVVTVSDDSTGLRAFVVDNLLSEDECDSIRNSARASSFERSGVGKDFPVLEELKAKKGLKRIFRASDTDGDGSLDEKEIAAFLRSETDIVDYNHTEFMLEHVRVPEATLRARPSRALKAKEFAAMDWPGYFARMTAEYPQRFARDSSQAWVDYKNAPVLQDLLQKVAAVTELPLKLVKKIAEPLQLLHYAPNGSHYSCHHDTSPDDLTDFRFMTFFIFLSDVSEGGETVLFGTDMNATYPERSSWGAGEWGDIEGHCQSTTSCPRHPGGQMRDPFKSAAVVKPKLGRALFWYNTLVDGRGRGEKFVWRSIHGGCPTRGEAKWAANVWLHAGPFLKHGEL